MLVDEHAYGDAAHVEAVQEVLDVLVDHRVHAEGLLVLHHALRHGGHHVVVPVADVHQCLGEAGGGGGRGGGGVGRRRSRERVQVTTVQHNFIFFPSLCSKMKTLINNDLT